METETPVGTAGVCVDGIEEKTTYVDCYLFLLSVPTEKKQRAPAKTPFVLLHFVHLSGDNTLSAIRGFSLTHSLMLHAQKIVLANKHCEVIDDSFFMQLLRNGEIVKRIAF